MVARMDTILIQKKSVTAHRIRSRIIYPKSPAPRLTELISMLRSRMFSIKTWHLTQPVNLQRRFERKLQRHVKLQRLKYSTNSRMSAKTIKKHCSLDSQAEELLHQTMTELNISARGYNKILKVGRTIADLDHSENVRLEHISEAVQYRNLDRDLWKWWLFLKDKMVCLYLDSQLFVW